MMMRRLDLTKWCYPDWPESASMEEWSAVHKEARKKKFRYWVSQTMPSYFAVKKMQLDDIRYWFKYRLQKRHKYHLVDTKLKPSYYETDKRMIYAMFSLLVDHVEIEKAQYHYLSLEKGAVKPSQPIAGLKHLDWEITLTHGEYPHPELEGKPTPQAIGAQEIKDLYMWWTVTHANRMDPMDDSLFDDESFAKEEGTIWEMMSERTQEQRDDARNAYLKREAIAEAYDAEDEKMAIRLIRIRKSLWT